MESGNGLIMPVSPMYGGAGGSGFNNGFCGDGWWIILFLFALMGNRFGGWGGNNGGIADGSILYPWMNESQTVTNGFQNMGTQNQITAVQSDLGDIQTQLCGGFADVQNTLCNGFAGVNATVNTGFSNAEASANTRQMANMQQVFGLQTAMSQGFNNIQSQFADCCCENRLANCQTQNIIQNEGNQTRFADANNTSAIMNAINGGVQSIKDQLCQDKIDAKNDEIAQLRQRLYMSDLAASQTAQTASLERSNTATVDALYNRLSQCPVPCMPVYGMQPIFTCNNGSGCGCGNF